MDRIAHNIVVAAEAAVVFAAITQERGLRSWWTRDATAEPVPGGMVELGFYNRKIVTRFEIEELRTDVLVRWRCIAGPPEYGGSRIVFALAPTDRGTRVQFEHRALAGDEAFLTHATESWRRVLESLRSYAETGEAAPVYE